jgi:hypothetical protein
VKRCSEGGCKAVLPAGGEIVSGSAFQRNHHWDDPLADCMVFWSSDSVDHVAAIELKSGGVDVSHVLKQLRGGARVIEGMLSADAKPVFYPILLHRGLRGVAFKTLQQGRVAFRGRSYRTIPARCGANVGDVVARFDG